MEFQQSGTTLKVTFPEQNNHTVELRLSTRVFRKFTRTVLEWVRKILAYDKSFNEYYTNLMYVFSQTRDIRLVLNEEFIQRCQEIAKQYIAEKINIVVTEGVLTREQLTQLYEVAFALKLVAPFLYTTTLLEEERSVLFKRLVAPLIDNGVNEFLFEFVRLKFLARAGASLWSWMANNRFQDINYHVLNTYNTVLTQILLQLVPSHNPMAYIKSVVEYSIYYLLTDVYDDVRHVESELKKVRYMYSYSLIQKHAVKHTISHITENVKQMCGLIKKNPHRTFNVKPIMYITLPFLTKLMDVSYVYFSSVRNIYYLNVYVSAFLEKYASNLVTLRQLTKCFATPTQNRFKITSLLEQLTPLYELDHPLKSVFQETRVYDTVVKELLSYDYWDLYTYQPVQINHTKLVRELTKFYEALYTDKWKLIFDTLRSNNYDLEVGGLSWKV